MTAVPIPRNLTILPGDVSGRPSLFPFEAITKNLAKEFDTPQVDQMISRMSNEAYIKSSEYMKVFVRIRPLTVEQLALKEDQNCMEISEDAHVLALFPPKESGKFKASTRGVTEAVYKYAFTKVFQPDVGQKDFFDGTALKIVEDFIGGQDALMFTYGVTSSGKTYTMQGSTGNEGIIPRSIDVIFNSIGSQVAESCLQPCNGNTIMVLSGPALQKREKEKKELMVLAEQTEQTFCKDSLEATSCSDAAETTNVSSSSDISEAKRSSKRSSFLEFINSVADNSMIDISMQGPMKYLLFVSFIEIYKENIYDLLQPIPKGKGRRRCTLKLAELNGIPFVKDVREIQVISRDEIFKLLTVGQNHLHMAETKLNHNSSRSHCIFTIKMISTAETDKPNKARVSQLSFCDLAGSERWRKTNAFGERLKEAVKINSSLLTLGRCIETLRYNQQHRHSNPRTVPYRESKLTRLFQSVLKGHGRACMIVNVNQCSSLFDETTHVLKFSAIVTEIKVPEKPPVRQSYNASVRTSFRGKKSLARGRSSSIGTKRATIGWEPAQTPIKEQEEETDEKEQENKDEEEVEESSESESGEEEEEEFDLAYWKEREEKMFKVIRLLQEKVSEEKENVQLTEERVRLECEAEFCKRFVEIEDRHEDTLERQVQSAEDFGERKYMTTVTCANNIIKAQHDEKRALEQQNKELDEECDELDAKLEEANEKHKLEMEEITENLTRSKDEISSLKAQLSEKNKELNDFKEKPNSKDESTSTDNDEFLYIKNLLQENTNGREIIQEQLEQNREMGEKLEGAEKELERVKQVSKDYEKRFLEAESKNKDLSQELAKLKEENMLIVKDLKLARDDLKKSKGIFSASEDALKIENKEFRTQLKEVKEINDKSTAKFEAHVTKLTDDLETVNSEFEKSKQDLKRVASDFEKEQCELTSVKQELNEVKSQLVESTEEIVQVKTGFDSAENELCLMRAECEKAVNDHKLCQHQLVDARNTIADLERYKEAAAEEIQKLKSETDQAEEKNTEVTSALEEAINCAEMKTNELYKLKEDIAALEKENKDTKVELLSLKDEAKKANNMLRVMQEESEKMKLEAAETAKAEEEKMRDDHNLAVEDLLKKHNNDLQEMKAELKKEKQETVKAHKKELLSRDEQMRSANDEAAEVRKELDIADKLEKQLMAEIDRLQAQLKKLESEKTVKEKQVDKRSSKAHELAQEVHILTAERDDLLKTVERLQKELSKASKEKQTLESNRPVLSVAEASELETLKSAMKEMDQVQVKQQEVIKQMEEERADNERMRSDLTEKVELLEKEKEEVNCKLVQVSSARDAAEASRSGLAEALKKREVELKRYEDELQGQQNETQQLKRKLDEKEKQIKCHEEKTNKMVESHEKEVKRFREARDRISSALEVQINTQKSCNQALKEKLEDQIEANVGLRSENSRLKAVMQVHEKVEALSMRRSLSMSVLQPTVKKEFPSVMVELSRLPQDSIQNSTDTVSDAASDVAIQPVTSPSVEVNLCDMSTGMIGSPQLCHTEKPVQEEMETQDENKDPKAASQDPDYEPQTSRGRRTKRTSSRSQMKRRGRVPRQATPIPENAFTADDDPIDSVPAKTRRKRTTRTISTESISVKTESTSSTTDNDEKDNTLTSETVSIATSGHSPPFPKSEMEIDVTPQLKKSKNRKRTMKRKEDDKNDSNSDYATDIKSRLTKRLKAVEKIFETDVAEASSDMPSASKSKPRRRGRATQDPRSNTDEDMNMKSKASNIARMGDIIKNSPVGQAFKKFEAAISPSRSPSVISAPTALSYNDPPRQSTRRLRKLHTDDISLPLECTPDNSDAIGSVGRGVGVLNQTQNMTGGPARRLRRRK